MITCSASIVLRLDHDAPDGVSENAFGDVEYPIYYKGKIPLTDVLCLHEGRLYEPCKGRRDPVVQPQAGIVSPSEDFLSKLSLTSIIILTDLIQI